VISVAAVDENKQKASFSNYGSTIELAAPSVNVLSTVAAGNNTTSEVVWSSTAHDANAIKGTLTGTVTGQICNCGLATGLDEDNSCPDSVAGNIAHIRRGDITFAEKVAHAESKGAIGVIISNNVSGTFLGTLGGVGSESIIVSISKDLGDELEPLAENGITGTVTVDISTTGDIYEYYSGTSMATPHVAGVAALVFAAQGGNISSEDVRDILDDSAEDLGDSGWDEIFGYGLVDVDTAFEIMEPVTCDAVWVLGYGYPADIDMDCYIEWNDLRLLAIDWLSNDCSGINEWCNRTDIDQNNSVSFTDFAELASIWLACNNPEDINCVSNWP
jgi:subtilisin family serine protease